MATVQQIYDMAIHLMDDQSEKNGQTMIRDNNEYRFRTLSILNSVIPALYPYSGNWDGGTAGRPAIPLLYANDHENPRFDQPIPLDDTLCFSLLPYYLAAQLKLTEDPELHDRLMNRYREAFYDLRSKGPESFVPIKPVYGLF